MKKFSIITIFFILLLVSINQLSQAANLTLPKDTPAKVYFSPQGGCTEAIISQIDRAKTEILVQAYSFTSAPIAKVLVTAHKRGVKVQAILDKSQRSEKYTSATFLTNAGILERIKSADTIDAQNAMGEYSALVFRFYQDNEHLMAPQQYRVAKTDFEYFMRLVELAIQYSATGDQAQ